VKRAALSATFLLLLGAASTLTTSTPTVSAGTQPPPAPVPAEPTPRWTEAHTPPTVASRHRAVTVTETRLDVTCYVATGNRTASGAWPREGMAASNRHPFGTRLYVEGVGVVTVTDRIGHSSELDLFYGSLRACREFGRRSLVVAVVR
jgi:resuscitation-promoting factor RpfB